MGKIKGDAYSYLYSSWAADHRVRHIHMVTSFILHKHEQTTQNAAIRIATGCTRDTNPRNKNNTTPEKLTLTPRLMKPHSTTLDAQQTSALTQTVLQKKI